MKINNKVNNYLDYQIKEILEDIVLFSPLTACVLFFKEKKDGLHYVDYEVATTEDPTIGIYPDQLDFEVFDNIHKAKDEAKLVPGFTNIIYDDESYKIISLKDLLKIVLKIEHPERSNDSIVIQAYLLINSVSSYKLAQLTGISKQAMSQFLLGQRPFPEKIKQEVVKCLKIDSREFYEEIEQFLFDENDL